MSLYVLDTDTLSLLQHAHVVVQQRVLSVPATDVAITIISVEEQLTGWQTALRRARDAAGFERAYDRMTAAVRSLSALPILSFSQTAFHRYEDLIGLKLNVGKMDLRIGAIALEHGAVVVTRNVRDFGRIPNLVVEDWSV